jgi:hypothetical protein
MVNRAFMAAFSRAISIRIKKIEGADYVFLALVLLSTFILLSRLGFAQSTGAPLGPIGANNLPNMPLYEKPPNGNAIVYGVNSEDWGYVPASSISNSGCADPNNQYVYEQVCNFSGTATSECVSVAEGKLHPCTAPAGANVDFMVLPNADWVIQYYHCMPGDITGNEDLLGNEAEFAAFYFIPGVGAFTSALSLVTGVPRTPLDWPLNGCTPSRAINTVFALANLYGISFVTGILLPIINILVAIAAIAGIATLLGGDTSIVGLERLI